MRERTIAKRAIGAALAGMILVLQTCGGGGGDTLTLPAPLSARYSVDGDFDLSSFSQVYQRDVDILDTMGTGSLVKTVTLRWAVENDDRDVYIAIEWDDDTFNNGYDIILGPTDFDGIKLQFDVDGDGTWESGEDGRMLIAATVGSQYLDQHVDPSDETDLIGDGLGKLKYDSVDKVYRAEFLFPMEADAQGQDGDLASNTRCNFVIFDHFELPVPSGNVGYAYGAGTDSSGWPELPLTQAGPHARPELPSSLTGLIVFISEHEEAKGEIYSFNPATATVTRVTTAPNLFKDTLSLSHDRTKVAFLGAPDKTDYASYEIYTVNIDGTGLTQVTSNVILDGHPAWSPDDLRIAYASFRNAGRAAIVVMTASGTEVAELTPFANDDNDPEYLADGRIVFKTDRFSALPQVNIGVMNEDGTAVSRVTDVSSVSDHDPVGDGTYAIFERFMKGTDYATDPESLFTPWNIIEAKLDGSEERTVLNNGFINWLPLYDPTGRYICYQRSTGYTDVRLMTRQGEDLGRLIPDITKIRYIDWK